MDIKIPKKIIQEKLIIDKANISKEEKKKLYDAKEWYTIRALLGNQWANWFLMVGARER